MFIFPNELSSLNVFWFETQVQDFPDFPLCGAGEKKESPNQMNPIGFFEMEIMSNGKEEHL